MRRQLIIVLMLFVLEWPTATGTQGCATQVTVVLWFTNNQEQCHECQATKAQWLEARNLFDSLGVRFEQADLNPARRCPALQGIDSALLPHRQSAKFAAQLQQSGVDFTNANAALTVHQDEHGALVIAVARGAEVSFPLNSLCRLGAQYRFPLSVLNTIRILQGVGKMPRSKALALAQNANLDAWDPSSRHTASPLLESALSKDLPLVQWLLEGDIIRTRIVGLITLDQLNTRWSDM